MKQIYFIILMYYGVIMEKHFALIRRKTRLAALVTAVILGIGVGVTAVSALLLVSKLSGIKVEMLYYIIAGAAMPVVSCVAYFVFAPSDKRLAKRLDEEHGLNEKMRTMVEFKNSNDAFMKLQREDADEKLGQLKVVPWRKRQLIAAILVLIISVGCFVGAAVVPRRPDGTAEPPVGDFDKQWIIAELTELTEMVEKSLVVDSLKETALKGLKGLISFVRSHDYMSEMKTEAIQVVLSINSAFIKVNSANKIGECFAESTMQPLKELGGGLLEISGSKSKKALDALQDVLEGSSIDDAAAASDEITSALRNSGVASSNALCSLLNNLSSALRIASNGDISIDDAFGTIPAQVSTELMVQNINKRVIQDQVIPKLCEIFSITLDDLSEYEGGDEVEILPPSSTLPPEEDDSDVKDPDQPIGGGGMGTGDLVYGSNDVIYDPYTNTYVAYGTLLAEYNAKAIDMIEDGKIPPDFSEFVNEYFKTLSEYKPEGETDKKQ